MVRTAADSFDEVTLEDLENVTYSDRFESFTERSHVEEADPDFTPVSSIPTSIRTNSGVPLEKSIDRMNSTNRCRAVKMFISMLLLPGMY